jgi:nucleoside-diphosphate-sugar epimerase
MINVLVIGSDGFIGRNLVHRLNSENYNLYCLSRNDMELYPFKCIDLNIVFDVVINCSGFAHAGSTKDYTEFSKYLDRNYYGLKSLLNKFVLPKTKLIYLSTTNIDMRKFDNNSVVKLLSEEYIKSNVSRFTILRLPLVYGEYSKGNFDKLVNFCFLRLPLPFLSLCKNLRSLLFVKNLVDLINVCIENRKSENKTFNVTDDKDISTFELVNLISQSQNNWPFFVYFPVWALKLVGKLTGKSDMISSLTDSYQVDISHTKELLEWTPPYSIEEGLVQSIKKTK